MKPLILAFAFLIPHHAFANVQTESTLDVYCPVKIALQADIGPLSPAASNDVADYREIAHSRIEGVYARTRTGDTCLLTESDNAELGVSSSHRKYLEVKKLADGSIKVTLEGYTKNGKLYSIRSRIDATNALTGRFDALVFQGSGGHEKL